jgi:hypothetical protein
VNSQKQFKKVKSINCKLVKIKKKKNIFAGKRFSKHRKIGEIFTNDQKNKIMLSTSDSKDLLRR